MLLKLIKYDIKSTYARIMLTFAAFTLLCIIVPPVMVQFQKGAALIFVGLAIPFGIMAMFTLVFIFLFQRYNSNFYSNEGYLMFSLPTRGRYLLASKLIAAFIWTTVGSVLMMGAFGAMFYVFSFEPRFIKILIRFLGNVELSFSQIALYTVLYIVGTVLFYLEIYVSISVAKLPLWHKFGVLMGFVTFFVVNIVESIPSWLTNGVQMINESISESVIKEGNMRFYSTMSKVYSWTNMWLGIVTATIFSVVLFVAISWLLEKKTSLK